MASSSTTTLLTITYSTSGWTASEASYVFQDSSGNTVGKAPTDAALQTQPFTSVSITLTWAGPSSGTPLALGVAYLDAGVFVASGGVNVTSNAVRVGYDGVDPTVTFS